MQVEFELRDDAEVASAAAQAPEQVCVAALAGVDGPAGRGDDGGRREVVTGAAELPHRPADATAEREPGDAGARDETARGREAVGLRLVIDVGPDRAAADAGPHRRGIDVDATHRREVDHDAVVDGREAGDAVAATAD